MGMCNSSKIIPVQRFEAKFAKKERYDYPNGMSITVADYSLAGAARAAWREAEKVWPGRFAGGKKIVNVMKVEPAWLCDVCFFRGELAAGSHGPLLQGAPPEGFAEGSEMQVPREHSFV